MACNVPVQMDVHTGIRAEQLIYVRRSVVESLEVVIETAAPGVAIRLLLDDCGLFREEVS